MDEVDVYRSAKLYIDQYGADAPVHAAMKADAMLERGDMAGTAVRKRIVGVMAKMQATGGRTSTR